VKCPTGTFQENSWEIEKRSKALTPSDVICKKEVEEILGKE